MPKRKSVKRHESTDIQGEGSYVILASVKVGRIRQLRGEKEGLDMFTLGVDLLSEHLVDWNWVDDEGQPLANPREHPEVLDDLTEEEATYLVQLLISSEKN